MMSLQYNPVENNFVTYEAVPIEQSVTYNSELIEDPLDLSEQFSTVSNQGIPIAKNTLPTATRSAYTSNLNTEADLNINFKQLLKEENIKAKVTSSFRKNAKTKSGKNSYHSQLDEQGNPMAYDIVPTDGDFNKLLDSIYSNSRIVNWLKQKGYGILEETTSNIMKKTGATGAHLHIGPDSSAIEMFNKRISKAQEGMKIEPFVEYVPVQEEGLNQEISKFELHPDIELGNNIVKYLDSGIPLVKSNLPTATRSISTYEFNTSNNNSNNNSSNNSNSRATQALNFFIDKGLEKHHAQGIVANLMQESALNPEAKNASSGAYGIAQWLGGRKTKLFKKYGSNPTFDQQLEFIWEELNSTESSAYQALLKTKNSHEATNSFMKRFERPSQREMSQSIHKRLLNADSLA